MACAMVAYASALSAGVAPVDGIPDYNATYWGTPSTGAVWDSTKGNMVYTTLYRDNYDRSSGCAGEGCGKHPGVDIAVPSGTKAKAVLPGKVIRSECNSTWGGLVVIEADNPHGPGKVYPSYAHLRKRDVSVGNWVSQGQTIGYTGGDPDVDTCPGGSTGAHLHFQVDKPWVTDPNRQKYPWYPTGRTEDADDDFEVTEYTHNPVPFVLGSGWWNWTFAEDGNNELWGCANVLCSTEDSSLWMDGNTYYPYAGQSSWLPATTCSTSKGKPCSREVTIDADVFQRMALSLDFKCEVDRVYMYWRTAEGGSNWYSAHFTYSGPKKYTVSIGNLASWSGIVTDFLIRPQGACTNYVAPYHEYEIRQVYLIP